MWKIALLSLVAYSYAFVPSTKSILYDPTTYDVLYDASKGPYNETWTFGRNFTLYNLIVPSQKQIGGAESNYDENISVRIIRRTGKVYQYIEKVVGEGLFKGNVKFGTQLAIPVLSVTDHSSLVISDPPADYPPTYLVEITFNKPGLYPWYNRRRIADICVVSTSFVYEGYVIGMEYSIL